MEGYSESRGHLEQDVRIAVIGVVRGDEDRDSSLEGFSHTVVAARGPVAELGGHLGCVNAAAWAPHSSAHVCTAGDDAQALIWDLSQMTKRPVEDPILAYNADGEINNLMWSAAQPDWVSIAFHDKLQILRV